MLNSEMRLAVIVSRFNEEVTGNLLEGCVGRLMSLGFRKEQITVTKVPGAVEIPLIAELQAASGKYHAIIALGAVIRGETTHYDYVCDQVSQGCQEVMMNYHLPVIFGVLTTENDEQAIARATGPNNKGAAAADAAIEMVNLVEELKADLTDEESPSGHVCGAC